MPKQRFHRFDSGRRLLVLPRRLIALATLCAALAAAPGCGGDDKSSDDAQAAKSQDAQAKSDVRNLASNVEACYAEQQTYEPCGTPEGLGDTGLPLGSGPGQVEVADAGLSTYKAVGYSESGTKFILTKQADGSARRSCDAAGKGGCAADGTW